MIHIACNIDANFIQHCAVTLVSLFENNKRADICVHIVAPYLSEADQAILRNLAAPYGNEVCFYYPPKDLLQCFSIKSSASGFPWQLITVACFHLFCPRVWRKYFTWTAIL